MSPPGRQEEHLGEGSTVERQIPRPSSDVLLVAEIRAFAALALSLQALLRGDPAATGARDQKMLHGAEPPSCPYASRCWSKFGELGLVTTLCATLEVLHL